MKRLFFPAIIGCFLGSPIMAQIVPDNTLGNEKSQVNSMNSNTQQIDGGAIRGANLFHDSRTGELPPRY